MSPDGEYAAYATYSAVIEEFGQVEPYVAIRSAELRHVEALTRQLERRGVTVPDNPYLGGVSAPVDLSTAAAAWADGEVANVALYDELLTLVTDDVTLTRVLTNLRRASLRCTCPRSVPPPTTAGSSRPNRWPSSASAESSIGTCPLTGVSSEQGDHEQGCQPEPEARRVQHLVLRVRSRADLREKICDGDVDEVAGRERHQPGHLDASRPAPRRAVRRAGRSVLRRGCRASACLVLHPLCTRIPKSPSSWGTSWAAATIQVTTPRRMSTTKALPTATPPIRLCSPSAAKIM